jgi:sugar (pentulose or hexulose) kinase
MSERNYLALDLGAESGRAIVGTITGDKFTITEVHRFANQPVRCSTGLHWDVSSLWREFKNGIPVSVKKFRLESLALIYRLTLKQLAELTGRRLDLKYIIDGGTQNRLLNQLTADCTRRIVVAGPIEATAIGIVLMQAVALRHLESSSKARAVVRRSIEVETYFPTHQDGWDKALTKLVSLLKAKKDRKYVRSSLP